MTKEKHRLKEDTQASSDKEGDIDRDKKYSNQSMFLKVMSHISEK